MITIIAVRSCDCGLMGPEQLILQQAAYMRGAGHRFLIANLWDGEPPDVLLHEEARRRGLDSVIVRTSWDGDPRLFSRLRALFRDVRPDIIHTHGAKAEVATLAASCGLGVPLVGSFYGVQTRRPLASFIAESTSLVSLRWFRLVIANAQMLRSQLRRFRVDPRRIEVHLSTIDLRGRHVASPRERDAARAALGLTPDQPVISTISRLDHQKGHVFVLDAVAALREQYPTLTYLIVGDGITRALLEGRARELGIEDRVHFLGFRPDLSRICGATDVLVAASLSEGTSVALLEAMSYGTPILATAVGGTPELVQNDITGLLIRPSDSAAIAMALGRLLPCRELRARLGAEGRRRAVDRFSSDAGGRRLAATYDRVLQREISKQGRRTS
jgi:glycosyltransferase involved in cell wall biosynthesis